MLSLLLLAGVFGEPGTSPTLSGAAKGVTATAAGKPT